MAKKAARKTKKAAGKSKRTASAAGKASSKAIGEITELIQMMIANDLTEIGIEDGSKKISLKRGAVGEPSVQPLPGAIVKSPQAGQTVASGPQAEAPGEELLEIKSPMVGTFYTAPSPDSEPFVYNGSHVGEDSVVCIVEAMKVMNEIKADCSGTIVELCVKNTQPVEFGQVLFRVKGD